MAIVLRGWLAQNETRAYPLHDQATRRTSAGLLLPDDVLVDAHLSVPDSVGKSVFVSSLGVTPGLVSATFLATPNNPLEVGAPGPGTPIAIAVVRAATPVIPYRNYPVEALYPGVSGWVAFGTGANKQRCHLLFDDPASSWLSARCLRRAQELPITAAGKYGLLARLKGLVRLGGSDSISIKKERRVIDGLEQDALVFSLQVPVNSTLQETLRSFAEPCSNRPSEGTCRSPALQSINNVGPDGDGNVNIIFRYGQEIIGDAGDGLVIDYPLGLSQVCPPKSYDPYLPADLCEPSSSSSSSSSSSPSSSESSSSSEPPPPVTSSSSGTFCYPLTSGYGNLEPVVGEGLGTWEFGDSEETGTRLIAVAGQLVHHIVKSQYRYRVFANGNDVVISGLIRPTQTPSGEGHLIFGYQSTNNFFFGGLTLRPSSVYPGGRFFVGRKAAGGPAWPLGLGLGYNLILSLAPPIALAEVDYDVTVRVTRVSATTAQTRLSFTWVDPTYGAQSYVSPWIPLTSIDMEQLRVGLGCVLSPKSEFMNWCVFGGRLIP